MLKLRGANGLFQRNVMLTFLYSLAFFLSVQVSKPVWQDSAGDSRSYIGVRPIHLLPMQEHNPKHTSISVYTLFVIIFHITGYCSKLFMKLPATDSLICSSGTERISSLGSVTILLPILRI